MTDENNTPTATGESVATIEVPCPDCGESIKNLPVFSKQTGLLLRCEGCGREYIGHNDETGLHIDGLAERPAPPKPAEKPKERQVKSVEIVSIFGTDKLVGVSSVEETPDRVNVTGHVEEEIEVERDGKMKKEIKKIPACVSVPRSAIISMNKTYHN